MAEELRRIETLRQLLAHRPLGLFSDIDGTLSPIVANPADARITPRCRDALEALISEGVIVALITGRTLEMARRMTGLDSPVYAANHGITLWIDGREETSDAVPKYVALAQQIFEETKGVVRQGVFVEVTGPNLAFHYRRATDATKARATILSVIAASEAARSHRVRESRKVVELRPPLDIDKGTAVRELARRLGVASLLCLGDDQTDIDMFKAVRQLRDEGLPAAIVAVDSDEATSDLVANADYFVRGVPGVEVMLTQLIMALKT